MNTENLMDTMYKERIAAARRSGAIVDDRQRAEDWLVWMTHTRAEMARTASLPGPDAVRDFQVNNFSANEPTKIRLPDWPAFQWTHQSLKERIGGAPVNVQVNRLTNPDHDLDILPHCHAMPFNTVIDMITDQNNNNTYITAQNSLRSRVTLYQLFADIYPLPEMLPWGDYPYLWIGANTTTSMHHDFSNALICQIFGRKLVRMVRPEQTPLLGTRAGCFATENKWLDEETAAKRGIELIDYVLNPGDGLFVPVGWWHAVRAFGPSISATFTRFVWPGIFEENFPA